MLFGKWAVYQNGWIYLILSSDLENIEVIQVIFLKILEVLFQQ